MKNGFFLELGNFGTVNTKVPRRKSYVRKLMKIWSTESNIVFKSRSNRLCYASQTEQQNKVHHKLICEREVVDLIIPPREEGWLIIAVKSNSKFQPSSALHSVLKIETENEMWVKENVRQKRIGYLNQQKWIVWMICNGIHNWRTIVKPAIVTPCNTFTITWRQVARSITSI